MPNEIYDIIDETDLKSIILTYDNMEIECIDLGNHIAYVDICIEDEHDQIIFHAGTLIQYDLEYKVTHYYEPTEC